MNYFNFPASYTEQIKHLPLAYLPSLKEHTPVENPQKEIEKAKNLIVNQSDSLIIVGKYDPEDMLFALLPYLALSRPFVVFSPSLQVRYIKIFPFNLTKCNVATRRLSE